MSTKINVRFEQRMEAKSDGAEFARGNFWNGRKNIWIIPTGTEEEKAKLLEDKYSNETVDVPALWDKAIVSGSTLAMLNVLDKYGVPTSEMQRIAMLKLFKNHNEKELHVQWDSLISFSPSFYDNYNFDKFIALSEKYNLGFDIENEIRNSNMSEEEKAFIRLCIPM